MPDLPDLPSTIGDLQPVVERAVNRALRRLVDWVRVHSIRETGRELGVRPLYLRRRFKISIRKIADGSSSLWVGLNPVELHGFKRQPRQVARGVRAAGSLHKSAFINAMGSKELLTWRRVGGDRLPIEKVKEDIEDPALDILRRFEARATDRFRVLVTRQLEHELANA